MTELKMTYTNHLWILTLTRSHSKWSPLTYVETSRKLKRTSTTHTYHISTCTRRYKIVQRELLGYLNRYRTPFFLERRRRSVWIYNFDGCFSVFFVNMMQDLIEDINFLRVTFLVVCDITGRSSSVARQLYSKGLSIMAPLSIQPGVRGGDLFGDRRRIEKLSEIGEQAATQYDQVISHPQS
jgi:hypothetical protein